MTSEKINNGTNLIQVLSMLNPVERFRLIQAVLVQEVFDDLNEEEKPIAKQMREQRTLWSTYNMVGQLIQLG